MASMNESLPAWSTKAKEALGVHRVVPWSYGEIHSDCPQCGGTDRFVIWESGNAWCRQCRFSTRWNSDSGDAGGWKNRRRDKVRQAWMDFKKNSNVWIEYHQMCLSTPDAMRQWKESGIGEEDVKRWGLGYTPVCPSYRSSASLTIPVFGGGMIVDIRHRLITETPISGKYRSHCGMGIAVSLFNRDALHSKRCLIVEGEKKAIVMEKYGYATCGIYGAGASRDLLLISKKASLSVVVALDPDVEDQAMRLSSALAKNGSRVWIASFPDKPDEFILRYGEEVTNEVLRQAREVHR